jgi:hypothetical protein
MRTAWLTVAVLIVGCGSAPKPPPPAPTFSTVSGAPQSGTALQSEQLMLATDIRKFGVSSQGTLVVSLDDSTYEYTGGVLVERTLYAETGEPTSLGAVSSIGPRAGEGAWLAAANGLYELDGFYLTLSPQMPGQVRAAYEQPSGLMQGLWLATDQGLVYRTTAATNAFTIDGDKDVSQIVVEPMGDDAFAVFGGTLYRLTLTGDSMTAEQVPMTTGAVRGIAASTGNLYAATPIGLVRWNATLSPAWQVITLAADGQQLSLDAVATDPVSGTVWALAGSQVIEVDGTTRTSYPQGVGNSIAVDQLGDVWLMNGAQLTRLQSTVSGTAVSFASQVQPFISANCTTCHADFTTYDVFKTKAADALRRVSSGDMPRCTGGIPCAADQHLKPDQYSVLEQWIRGGMQP